MNRYYTIFHATCPINSIVINYALEITTDNVTITVEDLQAYLRTLTAGYHEALADALLTRFGGRQRLTATHHGVRIETTRP